MATAHLRDICVFLDQELRHAQYRDASLNGLQLETSVAEISHIAFSVDSGFSIAEKAIKAGAQLLVVHHGILWGDSERMVGPLARKLELMFKGGLSLYASHLPLDGHPTLGNAAQLARCLDLQEVHPCFEYGGGPCGVRGVLAEPLSLPEIAARLSAIEGFLSPPLALPFGSAQIRSIGIATGSGAGMISECAALGLDLLVTGEPKQSLYHSAKDLGCSALCVGHYASETFGVRALERVLKERFRVQTSWISEPTGI